MEQRRGEYRMDGVDRALSYTVLTDVLRQWLVIFCFAVSAALLAAAVMQWHYQPSYTSQATLYVTKKGLPNNVYDNESSAQVMAEHFEQILNSSILQKKVAEEIHLADFAGSASAEAVEGTNLINLAVTAASPELCFKLMQSILKNYSLVSDYMTGNAILEILKAPKVPLTPDQPFERRNIMIKAFLAAAACWVLIFGGLSWLKDTIRTEEDIEQKLEARRLGTLWHERNRKKRTDIRIDDPLISFRYMESLQKLTQHVQKKMEERKAQTLLVTSVLKKEGRSTVAENLALALSMRKEKVFLLNADFRKQNASWLADEEGHLKIENFQKLLESLKKENDYVIIDTPPFLQNADTEEMAQMADASLLVVAEHRAQAKDLNAALDLLNAQGEKNLGCVYNNAHVEFLRPMASYGYQYAYHYGRYGGHYERCDEIGGWKDRPYLSGRDDVETGQTLLVAFAASCRDRGSCLFFSCEKNLSAGLYCICCLCGEQ